MNMKKDTKSELVKFRITKEEKEKLVKTAKSENENLSRNIRIRFCHSHRSLITSIFLTKFITRLKKAAMKPY